MPYKISGTLSEAARIIILKESDWSIESNTTESTGAYEVDSLASGVKLVAARKSDGESIGYGNITPVFYSICSNASLEDEDCSDISDWVDDDLRGAVSEQITFDSKETFKFDSKTGADTNDIAQRTKDIGSIDVLGNRIVLSLSSYCDAIGSIANYDMFFFSISRSDWQLAVYLEPGGLFISDGVVPNEVGTDLVVQDTWQEWTFDVDISAGVENAVCDVYLDGALQVSDVDCSHTNGADGRCIIRQYGYTTDNQVSYIDWFKVGDGFV